jgi:hypothetical protein
VLDLERNSGLVPSSFKEVHFTSTGDVVINKGFENCFYHGTVRGFDDSQVVVSTCNGLSGLFYHGKNPETFYFIDPAGSDNDQISEGHLHMIYRAADMEEDIIKFCDALWSNRTGGLQHLPPSDIAVVTETRRVQRDVTSDEKIIELVLVSSHSQFLTLGSDTTQVAARSISLANLMDSLYKPLNTRIALVGVEIWTGGDRIAVVNTPSNTLTAFAEYRRNELLDRFQPHDNAQLLLTIDLDGATVGQAFVQGICSSSLSAGIIQDTFSEAATATILVHELGHNLGMLHDDSRTCDDCPTGCLMRAVFNSASPFTEFSTCSRQDYEQTLLEGFGTCLFNIPSILFGDPVCGNGFVEDGELCDCGSPLECSEKNDTCCNATSCQLFDGAECSSTASCCTDDCKFASDSTSCREKMNDCDLEDFCTGSSADCPDNLYSQDLTSCGTNDEVQAKLKPFATLR